MGTLKAVCLSGLKGLALLSIFIVLFPFQWNKTKTELIPPDLLILEDKSQSVLDWEQYEESQLALAHLIEELKQDFNVKHYTFAEQLVSIQDSAQIDHESTNLSAALQQLWQRYEHASLNSVVVFTDGIYNQGLDPYYLQYPAGIKTIWLGAGSPIPEKDITISSINYPKKIILGQTATFEIQLYAIDFNAVNTSLSLSIEGEPTTRYPVEFNGDQSYFNLQHEWIPSEPGWYEIHLSTPFLAGETHAHNNQQKFFVEVIAQSFDILILAAAPHPDVAFLHQLDNFIDQSDITVHYGPDLPTHLDDYDLVISHQWPSSLSLSSQTAHIQIVGALSTPSSFESWSLPPLRKLPAHREMLVQWREESLQVPQLFKLHSAEEARPPFWYHYQIPLAAINLGTVLAEYDGPSNVFAWMNADQPQLLLNGVGWWRWHLHDNQKRELSEISTTPSLPQTLFLNWIKYFQHLLSGEQLEVYTLKSQFYQNESIQIYAYVLDEFIKAHEEEVILKLWAGEEVLEEFTMHPMNPQTWTVDIGHWAEGLYQYKVEVVGREELRAKGYFEVAAQSLESLDKVAKWSDMEQWAQLTQSPFYSWEQIDKIMPYLQDQKLDLPVKRESLMRERMIEWSWWYLVILFLLTLGWYLRKKWNGYQNI